MGAKETAPEIASVREVGPGALLCAANVQESPASIGIFRIPRMNTIPRSMSKSNLPAPRSKRRSLKTKTILMSDIEHYLFIYACEF
ncbi:hypothetical protein AVEN_117579-1 [Araneus ventricosus]|uniref:Uncharacterized protein n=1 Tax=Araneus ventricosus TaxID=182803 RepID=A0A4Y2MY07_ARAVE|nr:hypothetical protein AVEN_117579-1 [Araneus ventricosus]